MANKIGVDKVAFDVTNNEQVTCALRTRIGGKLKPLDGASVTFTCHKPIDTGADDLAPEMRPDPQKPDKPGKDRDRSAARCRWIEARADDRLRGRHGEGRGMRVRAHDEAGQGRQECLALRQGRGRSET
jgi:hypothetical protein